MDGTRRDDVVIVGLACRFPDADNPGQLWHSVLSRRLSFRPLPPGRLPLDAYGGADPDQTYVTRAAVLAGWRFDRQRFRVPGDTYAAVDPAHWLALEVCAAALADAGFPDGDGLDRERAGVVLGNSLTGEFSRAATLRSRWPYVRRMVAQTLAGSGLPAAEHAVLLADLERRFKAPFPVPSDETLAGALSNTIAGRVCNHFDFHGTGYTVDAACASSLVAVATAAEAIGTGQLDLALAGGVDLSLDPFELVGFARVGALAAGEMRIYDADPTGFLPGEGCGVVALCRASYAERHGLRPYARLVGWATSSDGSGGLTRPELAGQRLALVRAYRRAGIEPGLVGLVEGHGTGTAVGDATELRTLLDVRDGAPGRAVLGSIKANIGHTKAAAGVAGLIKATLAVHGELLPPTTGVVRPHELLAGRDATLEVTGDARPWPTRDRYAAVNAMGFGGINAHVVLAGAVPTGRRGLSRQERRLSAPHPDYEVVVCTADRPADLDRRLSVLHEATGLMSRAELTDLTASLAAGHRGSAPVRFAAAVRTPGELADALGYARSRLAADGPGVVDLNRRVFLARGAPARVGLLFSGQAAPVRPGAGALAPLLGNLPAGYADPLPMPADRPADTSVAQPAIVRASLAGLRWLDLLGVRAEAAVGHSLGELTALVWAGALTEDEAYTLATRRGAVMAAASAEPAGMASLATDLAGATDLVAGTGAVVAADNAVRQVVVAGRRADVAAVVAAATERGVAATWLPVAHAFHSGLMAPAAQPLRMAAGQVAWHPPTRPVASTVTGTWWDGADPVELLVRQLTAPVRFREALALLDVDLFVEVGPGRILAGLTGTPTAALDVGTGSAEGLATATAALFAAGACDSVEAYLSRRATRPFDPAVPRRFLTNPCESGATPVPEPAGARRQVPVSAPEAVAAEPGTPRSDPLSAVTAHVAAAVDLDESAITPDARLLADLHLSSLRVGQLAAEVATALGRALPVAPLSLATASVAEFATAIAELPTADAAGGPPAPGVAAWVRVFGHHRVPRSAPDTPPVPRDWRLVGNLAGHPYAVQVRDAFRPGSGAPPARLLALPPGLVELPVDDIAAALRDSDADRVPLVVVHHQGVGAAVGRSLAAENPAVPVLVVEVPDSPAGIGWAAAEAHRAWTGFVEAAYDPTGVRAAPVTRPMEVSPRRDAEIPLGPGDVCLVTGGAKGIGAECAAALATATGATMVLLGRSPADDPEVRATLSRISGAAYRTVDLTDPAAVGATLAEVRAALGPVRVLLHAAGTNVPGRLAELTGQRLRAALAAKAAGLDHVLAALDLTQLRYGVTFGSVIGRTGLAGEADYAIANEWLARRCFELSLAVPEVRWLNIEWSAWTGVGMGVRLGALDGLVRQGLSPIPVEEGTDLLLRVLATPALPPTVMIAGRLPATPTLRWETADEESARFLETRLGWTSGVELVAEAALSLGTDPYLADHRIDGVAVLPAVLGLEAMAQAATALGAKPVPAVFEDVRLAAPVTVPERGSRVLRVAALVRDGGIDMVARSAETGFAVDHLAVRCRAATSPLPPPSGAALDGPLLDAAALYGPLFFHGPRFQRVTGYGGLSAYRCLARVTVRDQQRWFGSFQPQRLELGDPGARDAFLHVLQGCVPDRRVLPTGVERLVVHRRAEGTVTVDARQRDEDGDRYVFDMSIRDGDGGLVEEWYGLALRGIAPLHRERWPVELLGAYLTRSLRRWRPQVGVDLAVAAGARGDPQRTRDVAGWLAGTPVTHAGDGRPVAVDGTAVSASHLDGRLLVAAGPAGTAVDWQRVAAVPLVDPATGELARRGEDPAVAATRIWTCREVLAKHGAAPDAPLVVDVAGPDGWFLLRSGGYALYSVAVPTDGAPVAVCVGAGEPDA